MNKFIKYVTVVAATLAAGTASAAIKYATTVVDYEAGLGTLTPLGAPPADKALGAPDSAFISLGSGGFIVLGFDSPFIGGPGVVFESTNTEPVSWPETADVFVGTSWTAGDGLAALLASFTPVLPPSVDNDGAVDPGVTGVRGFEFAVPGGTWFYLAVVDTTNGSVYDAVDDRFQTNSAFDLNAAGVTPVPVPAALPLLGSALLGMFVLRRRQRAA